MLSKKHGQLYAKHGMPSANLETLCSNLGMLQVFAGTPREDEEGIREESRGHRVLLSVRASSRRERCEREEPLSEGQATL
jgi:hypothetical protein